MRIDFGRIGRGLEKSFIVLGLFIFTDAVFPLVGQDIKVFVTIGQTLKTLIYVMTIVFSLFYFRSVFHGIHKNFLVWVLVAFALLSTYWSWFPPITLQKGITLSLVTLFGVYLGVRNDLEKMLQLLAVVMGLLIVLSFVFALALPEWGVDHIEHVGAWQGVYSQKNPLGRMMVLSSVVFTMLSTKGVRYRVLSRIAFFLSVLLIFLSTSKTALVIVCLLLLLFYMLIILRRKSGLKIPLLIGLLLLFGGWTVCFFEDTQTFFSLLGRDMTLTGRTDLWNSVIYMIQKEFWFGYGYYAFWRGMDGPSAFVWEMTQWNPPHSHNGLLDLWLDLGLFGVVIFSIGLIRNYVRAVQRFLQYHSIFNLWPLMYVSFMVFYNITESAIISNGLFFWTIYVATFTSLARRREESRD